MNLIVLIIAYLLLGSFVSGFFQSKGRYEQVLLTIFYGPLALLIPFVIMNFIGNGIRTGYYRAKEERAKKLSLNQS